MTARRRSHAKSRALPTSTEPDMPSHLRMLTLCALAGTLEAPVGSSLPQIYLAAARHLIRAAQTLQKALS